MDAAAQLTHVSAQGVEGVGTLGNGFRPCCGLAGETGANPLQRLHERLCVGSAVVAVVGLGYVGLPLLLSAADAGFRTLGIDVDGSKVGSLRRGRSYISDVADSDLARLDVDRITTDAGCAILADVIVVTVPTPLLDGGPDLSIVVDAMRGVAEVLRPGQLVVLESTT